MERLLYGGFCRSLDLFFQILTSFEELKNLCLTIEAGTLCKDDDERVSNCGKPLSCSFCGDSRSQGKGKTKED